MIFPERKLEGLQHLLVLASLIHFAFFYQSIEGAKIVHTAQMIVTIIAFKIEGVRTPQFAFTLVFLFQIVMYAYVTFWYTKIESTISDTVSIPLDRNLAGVIAWTVAALTWLHSIYFAKNAGAADFSALE